MNARSAWWLALSTLTWLGTAGCEGATAAPEVGATEDAFTVVPANVASTVPFTGQFNTTTLLLGSDAASNSYVEVFDDRAPKFRPKLRKYSPSGSVVWQVPLTFRVAGVDVSLSGVIQSSVSPSGEIWLSGIASSPRCQCA